MPCRLVSTTLLFLYTPIYAPIFVGAQIFINLIMSWSVAGLAIRDCIFTGVASFTGMFNELGFRLCEFKSIFRQAARLPNLIDILYAAPICLTEDKALAAKYYIWNCLTFGITLSVVSAVLYFILGEDLKYETLSLVIIPWTAVISLCLGNVNWWTKGSEKMYSVFT